MPTDSSTRTIALASALNAPSQISPEVNCLNQVSVLGVVTDTSLPVMFSPRKHEGMEGVMEEHPKIMLVNVFSSREAWKS